MCKTGFLGLRGGNYLSLDFKSLPAANFTLLEALILIFSPVLGLIPRRALRLATLNVPKPDQLHGLALFQAAFDAFNHGLHGALRLCLARVFSERFLDCLKRVLPCS